MDRRRDPTVSVPIDTDFTAVTGFNNACTAATKAFFAAESKRPFIDIRVTDTRANKVLMGGLALTVVVLLQIRFDVAFGVEIETVVEHTVHGTHGDPPRNTW